MTETLLTSVKKIKEPIAVLFVFLLTVFGAGAASAGYLGLPDRVTTLERDMSAVLCLLVVSEESNSSVCRVLMSEQTRNFILQVERGSYQDFRGLP